ncbi:hypothetical protein [Deinococcus aestuarii]|uniref:hypothetical protein n=1 Tax=Deinococcus aestuarii TaxID=2774531 RepID=UPI001C0C6EA1|nr:hypothetical protein [Deinococcus aestuarii]
MSPDTESEAQRDVTLRYLGDAVRALAQPALVQKELCAENPLAGDELAVDFEAWYEPAVRNGLLSDWLAEQREAIEQVDALLTKMASLNDMGLWTQEALETSPWWEKMRVVARRLLIAVGWSLERPLTVVNVIVVDPKE